jgi:redox-sensing transcriptional repressor
VAALFDTDPAKVGTVVAGNMVHHIDDLADVVAAEGVAICMIATPEDAAQGAADEVAHAGVKSILNFAPTVLKVADGIDVRRVDLSTELQILTYYLTMRD